MCRRPRLRCPSALLPVSCAAHHRVQKRALESPRQAAYVAANRYTAREAEMDRRRFLAKAAVLAPSIELLAGRPSRPPSRSGTRLILLGTAGGRDGGRKRHRLNSSHIPL